MKIDDEITAANAVDIAKSILFSLDPRLRSQDLYLYCSQDFVDKYNEGYLLTHGGIPYNTQYGQGAVEGSNGKLKFCPLYNKAGSKFMHVTTKSNMLVGYDQMGDVENVMVKGMLRSSSLTSPRCSSVCSLKLSTSAVSKPLN